MKAKTVATSALLAFVIASVVFLVGKEAWRSTPGSGTGGPSAGPPPGGGSSVIAYYFHGTFRCASCVKVEALSRKAVVEGFPEEIRSGRLAFREVNIDEPENRRFLEEYRLSSQSLVIVQVRDGRQVRWQNMEKVWTLLDSEKEFIPYVRGGVSAFLEST